MGAGHLSFNLLYMFMTCVTQPAGRLSSCNQRSKVTTVVTLLKRSKPGPGLSSGNNNPVLVYNLKINFTVYYSSQMH